MPVIIIGLFDYKDEAAYRRYVELATPIFMREGVKFIVNDEDPIIMGGDIALDKVVVMEFRDKAHMATFFALPDYQEAAVHRDQGVKMRLIRVRRFPQMGSA